MTEDKLRRMVTGAVVGATTIITLLLTILVFLIVTAFVKKAEEKRLDAEAAYWQQQIAAGEDSIEYYTSLDGLKYLARENGFVFPGEE